MEFVTQLWLPIVLAGVAVWFWNFLSWAALNLHAGDFSPLPNDDAFAKAVRPLNLPPGTYGFPDWGSAKKDKEAFMAKWKAGPVGTISVWPSESKMGGKMIGSFLVYLAVSFLIAYLTWEALAGAKGVGFGKVMQLAGTAGVLGYCFAFLPNGIWFNAKPRAMVMCVIDGLIAGLGTGAIFAALWPST